MLLLLLAGCIHGYASEVRKVRTGLIGLHARALRQCLPVPTVDGVGDLEVMTFRWVPNPEYEWPDRTIHRPTAGSPGIQRWPFQPRRRTGRKVAYCKLVFTLERGWITAVRAEGRGWRGLNTSADCLLEARRCIPKPMLMRKAEVPNVNPSGRPSPPATGPSGPS